MSITGERMPYPEKNIIEISWRRLPHNCIECLGVFHYKDGRRVSANYVWVDGTPTPTIAKFYSRQDWFDISHKIVYDKLQKVVRENA